MHLLKVLLVFLLSMSANLTFASEDSDNTVLTIKMAVNIALNNNPGLSETQSRYEAMKAIPSQKGSLPDPMLTLGAMNFPTDTFDRTQEGMTRMEIGISQYFPFPGKLGLQSEAAEFDANAAGFSVDEVRLKLINNVESKWWQVFYLDRSLETIDLNKKLLKQFIEIAETKYETGKGLQQDVLLSQLELSKLIDQDIKVAALRRNQAIRLNVLMDRSPILSIVLPKSVPKTLPSILTEVKLYQLAANSRPILKSTEQSVSAAKSRLSLAERDFYPDFKLTAAYSRREGNNPLPKGGDRSDLFSLKVGIKIPLYAGSKQSKAVSQRTFEHEKMRYNLKDEKNKVELDISSYVTDYKRAGEQMSLFEKGIIPQAKQTVQSMLSGYQVSEVDFLNLVRSQITLFNYELQYWKALTEANQALSLLKAVVGEEAIYE